MITDRTPNLTDLTHALELRWRLILLTEVVATALAISLGMSLLTLLVQIGFSLSLPAYRVLLVGNGIAIVVAILLVAVRPRKPARFLIDADHSYGLKSLLVSGFEFGEADGGAGRASVRDARTDAFEALVIEHAEATAAEIDPRTVYPAAPPRRLGVVAALLVAIGILLVLDASGWFDTPVPAFTDSALVLEDAGRRLAERSDVDDELRALADELRRLGEQARDNELTADEARRRIDELNDEVEEQLRNLSRTPPLDSGENAEIPPETEETIRSALESGMGQGEVVEFFTRMQSEGSTIPEVVQALEDATPDRAPNANLDIDEEEMRELMDQLNMQRPQEEPGTNSDIVNDLEESRRVLQQMGSGLTELSEGEQQEAGPAAEGGVGLSQGERSESEQTDPSDEQPEGQGEGQQGGTQAVDDRFDDDFRPVEENSPIFREIEGIVTDNTIMDIIIRELPSEATSNLSEEERDVLFERVVEEAINREETPPELQALVRNYFLRLTLANTQGAEDEQ